MELPFTHKPGRRERHLRRKHNNPLFGLPPQEIAPEALLAAQKADHDELLDFRQSFVGLIQQTIDLDPDAGSDAVLDLKEKLEVTYEQICGLPEDHGKEKGYTQQLISLIMKALWRKAAHDPIAQAELKDEEDARTIHLQLLQQPLIADMLHPKTPITAEELAPCALNASAAEIDALVGIIEPGQLSILVRQAVPLLALLEAQEFSIDAPAARLQQMAAGLELSDPRDSAFN